MEYDWMDLPKERGDETELELALRELITWAVGNGSSKQGNPYCKPEIKRALKALRPVVRPVEARINDKMLALASEIRKLGVRQ